MQTDDQNHDLGGSPQGSESSSQDLDSTKSNNIMVPKAPDAQPLTLGRFLWRLINPEPAPWIDNLNKGLRWLDRIQAKLNEWAPFFQALAEIGVTWRDAHRTLIKYKWVITSSMPLDFVWQIAQIGRRKGNQRKAMNRLFIDYYSSNNFEHLVTLVEAWNANMLFQPRMRIFHDCVAVMQQAQGQYNAANVVIPTLIAQIDGIRTEFLKAKGLRLRRFRWVDANGTAVNWDEEFEKYSKDATVFDHDTILDSGTYVFLKILFQTAFHGDPLKTPFTFSRHKVMHGEYVRYGSRANTIRAFLVLDFLSKLG